MSRRVIVCRCEDVTLDEIQSAIDLGYRSIDELKRLTGFGTGPCQGKECQAHVAHLVEAAGGDLTTLRPFTARPPFHPTPLRFFAGVPRLAPDTEPGADE